MDDSQGWVKIHRKLKKWEWYDDPITKSVFLELLLTANFEESRYRGTVILRGQTIMGTEKMAKILGISRQSVRTSIKRLKSTNEITTISTSRGMVVTLLNYEKYQLVENQINTQINQPSNTELTINQPTPNHSKEYKERKEYKEPLISVAQNETFLKTVKWLRSFEKINNPEAFAKKIFEKYPERNIAKALNQALCTSPSQLYMLLDHYKGSGGGVK